MTRRNGRQRRQHGTYSEVLLCGEDFAQEFAGANTQRVAQQAHLLDVVGAEVGDVRLQVLGRVELQALALEGEDLGGGHLCKPERMGVQGGD